MRPGHYRTAIACLPLVLALFATAAAAEEPQVTPASLPIVKFFYYDAAGVEWAVSAEADRFELNYARLDGNIGLMTTGAGLGLAAIDMIVEEGGEAANFMDVRPMASRDQVAEGIMLLLRDSRVRVVMVVAMGGGILHCDTIAEGIATAYRKSDKTVPVVFHAAGTGKEISEMTLRNQGIPVAFADSIGEAAREAVRIAGSAGG